MHAAIRYFIAFLWSLLLHGSTMAQIRVELLNQTISAGYLGTGTDNYVRIHNLPAGAVVSISPGEALQVKGNEYVLCRLGVGINNGKTATLSIALKGKTLVTKEYRLQSTPASGTVYNPVLHMKIGHNRKYIWQGAALDKQWISYIALMDAVASREIDFVTDSSIKLWGSTKLCRFSFAMQAMKSDMIGSYKFGEHTTVGWTINPTDTLDKTVRSPQETMWIGFGNLLHRLQKHGKEGGVIFLENIVAQNENGGFYFVAPVAILFFQ